MTTEANTPTPRPEKKKKGSSSVRYTTEEMEKAFEAVREYEHLEDERNDSNIQYDILVRDLYQGGLKFWYVDPDADAARYLRPGRITGPPDEKDLPGTTNEQATKNLKVPIELDHEAGGIQRLEMASLGDILLTESVHPKDFNELIRRSQNAQAGHTFVWMYDTCYASVEDADMLMMETITKNAWGQNPRTTTSRKASSDNSFHDSDS